MRNHKEKLSEKNRPSYIKWALATRKRELVMTALGVVGCIICTPIILDPMNDNPIVIIALSLIAIYGYTIGMALQPYLIYRKLIKANNL